MTQVLALAMPFFGIILIGFLAGKLARLPRSGLVWLDFYLIYIALPALFFDILSRTPLEELARGSFALATTTSTFVTFVIALLVGRALTRSRHAHCHASGPHRLLRQMSATWGQP